MNIAPGMLFEVWVWIVAINIAVREVFLVNERHVHYEHEVMAAGHVCKFRTIVWSGVIKIKRIIARRVVEESVRGHDNVNLVFSTGASDE